MFWTGGKERPRKNCCWTVLSVIPARSVEMSPLSQVQLEWSIYLQYVITLSLFNFVCADFIFVGWEPLLSWVPRNAEWKDEYHAWRKLYLVSRSCPPEPFSLGWLSKEIPCFAWEAKRWEKIGLRKSRGGIVCVEGGRIFKEKNDFFKRHARNYSVFLRSNLWNIYC